MAPRAMTRSIAGGADSEAFGRIGARIDPMWLNERCGSAHAASVLLLRQSWKNAT
jgi:hypothetical protein